MHTTSHTLLSEPRCPLPGLIMTLGNRWHQRDILRPEQWGHQLGAIQLWWERKPDSGLSGKTPKNNVTMKADARDLARLPALSDMIMIDRSCDLVSSSESAGACPLKVEKVVEMCYSMGLGNNHC